MACMSVYCWYHNPLCELRHVQWELQSLSMHACVMQLHVSIKLKKLNVYTLQTCLTIQIVHPKGISIYDHMYTQFSEGGVG